MKFLIPCIAIFLFFFCVISATADSMPIDLTITQNRTSLIANGMDQTSISVSVTDRNTTLPIPDLPVAFSLDNPLLGSINPSNTYTDMSGIARTVFTSNTISGTAILSVVIDYNGTYLGPWIGEIRLQAYPDTVNLTGDTPWLVAGDVATTSLITVQALNQSNPVPMLDIQFSLMDSSMGSLSVLTGRTDSQGNASTRFTPSTKSGNAVIQAVVTYKEGNTTYTEPRLYIQQVDHAAPYSMNWYEAPSEALVGDNVTIKIHYVDNYNNSIDNRRFTENVKFSVTSPSTPNVTAQAGFWDGTSLKSNLTIGLDSFGTATTSMRMDVRPGSNRVKVQPLFSGVSETTIPIEGIAETVPVLIEQQISSYSVPNPYPNIPADGISVFTILYTLRDQYGNGVRNAYFWMNTTLEESESRLLITNASGQVKVTYGPKTKIDIITITATAVTPKPDLTHATHSQTVEVVSTEPVQMVLIANPQLIPSWDVPGERMAEIKAIVMDRYGNPVKNQIVNFTIGSWSYPYSSENNPKWIDSSLLTIQRNTSTQAYAVAYFRPGYFPGQGYPQEHDDCMITAKWANYAPQTATIQWTNVPFLSISTNVSPMVAAWNETVTVQVIVEGNGYALRPKPVDVMLLIDNSLSMRYDIAHDYGTSYERLTAAKAAAKTFIGNMNPSKDTVGLIAFSTTAVQRKSLTTDFNSVNQSIDSISTVGYTNMRDAFKMGIEELAANGRSDAIKAIILLSDGEWNYDGSPVAHGTGWTDNSTPGYTYGVSLEPDNYQYYDGFGGTLVKECDTCLEYQCSNCRKYEWVDGVYRCTRCWVSWGDCIDWGCNWKCYDGEFTNQNMTRYASANNVRLYDIFFASTPSQTVNTTLQTMADSTGGFYEFAPSASKLTEIFERIAGLLREEAGVGVSMDLPFDEVTVASNTSSWNIEGKEIFDYLKYTDEWKYWFNDTPVTTIYRYPNRDDTPNWTAGILSFNIGTMKLNQAWQVTYKLKVKDTPYNVGKITFFDDSIIRFSDGKQWYEVQLPTTYLTSIGGQAQSQIGTEEGGYEITGTTFQNTLVTKEFDRKFKVNGTAWTDPWYRTWYENYYIDIPGYMSKTKIGEKTIAAPVPLHGSFTFDLKPYLPPGVTSVDFGFYVEGTDNVINAVNRHRTTYEWDKSKIYILLE